MVAKHELVTMVMTMVTRLRSNRAMPRHLLQARIGHAALVLFRKSGFDSVSVDQIVAKAGVSKGAFFNFFPTKADALLVYFREIDGRIDKLRSRLDPTRPLAALEEFFVKAEALLRGEGSLLDTLSRAIWSHPTLMQADRISAKEDRRAFADFFDRARSSGAIEIDDPAVAADAVGDLWTGSILMWLGAGRSYSFADSVNAKLRLLFIGLRPRKKS
jgi:AcrR family transcriptional regulator